MSDDPAQTRPETPRLVVIDGPAGAGKSTVARAVAAALGVPMLDTGAIYRTLALIAKRRGISWDDGEALAKLAADFPIEFGPAVDGVQPVQFDGEAVTRAIRTPEMSEGASKVSSLPPVRRALLGIQRALGASGCVAEGRDMGTVVFPDAPHKFFLTADLATRAARRHGDLTVAAARDPSKSVPTVDAVAEAIATRDSRDSNRAEAPLTRADDAVLIDTSALAQDQVIARILDTVRGTVRGSGS